MFLGHNYWTKYWNLTKISASWKLVLNRMFTKNLRFLDKYCITMGYPSFKNKPKKRPIVIYSSLPKSPELHHCIHGIAQSCVEILTHKGHGWFKKLLDILHLKPLWKVGVPFTYFHLLAKDVNDLAKKWRKKNWMKKNFEYRSYYYMNTNEAYPHMTLVTFMG